LIIDTIFVPRGAEAGAVRAAVARAGSAVRIVETGIGPLAASQAAARALADAQCGTVLVTGLCGSLSAAFGVGDTLVYGEVRSEGAPALALDRELAEALAAKLPWAQTGIRASASDRIVESPIEKRALAVRSGSEAVDMESYAIVERVRDHARSVGVVRVTSDGPDDALPELERARSGSGGMDGAALALALVRRPVAGARLALNGTRALAALRRSVEALLA
jgi:nucleoside phosphorylase